MCVSKHATCIPLCNVISTILINLKYVSVFRAYKTDFKDAKRNACITLVLERSHNTFAQNVMIFMQILNVTIFFFFCKNNIEFLMCSIFL